MVDWVKIGALAGVITMAFSTIAVFWNARQSPHQGLRMADWVKIIALSAVIVLLFIVMFGYTPHSDEGESTTREESATTTSHSDQETPPSSTQETPECVDGSGNPAACTASGAGIAVSAEPCEPDAALHSLGVDPDVRPVDVQTTTVGNQCILTPGAAAESAGATAADIRALSADEAVANLSICYQSDSSPEVACSTPHQIEYVNDWRPDDGEADTQQTCDAAARRYTNRTFDSPTEELDVVILRKPGSFRCGVQAPKTLESSLWQIGGAALP